MKDVPVKKTPPPPDPRPVFLKLTIFTTHGATFTFQDVRIEIDNVTNLGISYRSQADGLWMGGTFIKANIAGYAGAPIQRPR
jgi:hypothetical protein